MLEHLQGLVGMDPDLLHRTLWSVTWIVLIWMFRGALLGALRRSRADPALRFRARRVSGYVASLLTFVVFASFWLVGFGSIATVAGLASAGLAIALKDVMASLAGWVFILWRRPFELGDRIEIAGVRGDVVDIGLLQHSLMEIGNWVDGDDRTGRVLHIPNSHALSQVVGNYTKGWSPNIWDELVVMVTFESNWQKARQILQEAIGVHALPDDPRQIGARATPYLMMDASTQPIVLLAVRTYGVELTARYVCDPRKRRGTRQAIWEKLLLGFADHADIAFAYPTQRFFDNAAEGKQA